MPSIGFGLERIGLLALRWPWLTLALVAVFSALCALGVPRLQTDHTMSELFRADTPAFRNYERLSQRFPTSEFDVLVVVEGDNLLERDTLETVRELHLELQLVDSVEGVLSMFSMREPPGEEEVPPPIFPAELPAGEAFDALAERALDHPLIGGRLLSMPDDSGAQLALIVVTLEREALRRSSMFPLVRQIDSVAREMAEPAGLRVQLAGAPVMQLEIRDAIRRDTLIYNGAGFLVGFLVNLIFFRRLKFVLITALCPAIAVLWALGLLGWIGFELNTFINVIPPLVLVITFTDAMHMVFSIRRHLADGVDRFTAARRAILNVGPACVLTSLTTSIAFLSLTFADSALITTFGVAAAIATLFAFVIVIAVVPTMAVLLFRDEAAFVRTESKRHQAIKWLEDRCDAVGARLRDWQAPVAATGLTVLVLFTALHLQLEPRYRLSDQVPDTKQSVAASERLDTKLAGAYPVHIMLEWPQGLTVATREVLEVLAEAHALLERESGIGNVWSVETLRRWIAASGRAGPEEIADYLRRLPEHLVRRFVNEPTNSALLTGRLPNLDSQDSIVVLDRLDAMLDGLRSRNPGFDLTVTGLSAVSAQQSSSMIMQLSWGLLSAIAVVIVLIGVAFRSVRFAAYSILPNLFPVVAAGSAIFLAGGGLEYASAIALTVAFGIAVDDTIHFLNRYAVEERRLSTLAEAVHETLKRIGPVLMLTTLVLVVGLAVTMISDLPAMRLFGQLFMITLAAAIVGDVLILPAIILAAHKYRVFRANA